MSRLSRSLFKDFDRKVRSLEKYRRKFEDVFENGHLSEDDILQAYAGLYLDLFTEFEALIENLFIGLLNGQVRHVNSSVNIKIQIRPKSEAETILLNGKSYLDWLPYKEKTLDRAMIYFNNGKPFSFLQSTSQQYLKEYHTIRNAIAHKSSHSLNKFVVEIIRNKPLLPREKTPRGYLRTIPIARTGKTYLEIVSTELTSMANIICS